MRQAKMHARDVRNGDILIVDGMRHRVEKCIEANISQMWTWELTNLHTGAEVHYSIHGNRQVIREF